MYSTAANNIEQTSAILTSWYYVILLYTCLSFWGLLDLMCSIPEPSQTKENLTQALKFTEY